MSKHLNNSNVSKFHMVGQSTIWDIPSKAKNIFKDKNWIREDGIPEKIIHRKEQHEKLRDSVFGPPIWGHGGSHIFCQGTTGTGKTLCTLHWSEVLKKKLAELKLNHTKFIYINCNRRSTQASVAVALLRAVTDDKANYGLDDSLTHFFKKIDEDYKYVIIVLDEVDKVLPTTTQKSDSLFYCLVRARELRELKNCYITLVCIANDPRATERLSDGTRSSFGINVLHFPRYNANQLFQILLHRAKKSLEKDVVDDTVIKEIAIYCADRGGDCRQAISLLRISAELAEKDARTKLTKEYFQRAKDVYEKEMYKKEIADMSLHETISFYTLIQLDLFSKKTKGKYPDFKKLYKYYVSFCEKLKKEPTSDRMVRFYFKNMVKTNFVEEFMDGGKLFYKVIIDPVMASRLLQEFYNDHELKADKITEFI